MKKSQALIRMNTSSLNEKLNGQWLYKFSATKKGKKRPIPSRTLISSSANKTIVD
ncbi:MAG: hypothetical protein ACMUEM_00060 [Flavobacteriales bacterium AspAUS03]